MVWPAIIGAAAALGGGLLAQSDRNVAAGRAEDQAANDRHLQMILAQNGITLRARDAMQGYKETGIHPLSLLGVQGPSYSPVNFVSSGASPMGDAISNAGQGIARAMSATATERERMAHAARLDSYVIERAGLENDLLRARIASEVAQVRQMANPAMPVGNRYLMDGQGNTIGGKALVTNESMKRTVPAPENPVIEPGAITDVGFVRTRTGWSPVPSKDAKERIEDMTIPSILWSLRNNLRPSFGGNLNPPGKAPPGSYWVYNPWVQEYQLKKHKPYVAYEGPIKFDK